MLFIIYHLLTEILKIGLILLGLILFAVAVTVISLIVDDIVPMLKETNEKNTDKTD